MASTGLTTSRKIAFFEYDFTRHGGAIGTISVKGTPIPKGSIIKEGHIHVKKAVTSAGAVTVQIMALTADDILASTLKGALLIDTVVAVKPVGTAASSIIATSVITALTVTVGVDTITAGKLCVALEYIPPTA